MGILNVDIGMQRRSQNTLHCSKTKRKDYEMFASMLKTFDRATLSLLMVLAVSPILAVAVTTSIH